MNTIAKILLSTALVVVSALSVAPVAQAVESESCPSHSGRSYCAYKLVDKAQAKAGDVLTYTLIVKNTGSVNLTNVRFAENIPAKTTYVMGSSTAKKDTVPYFINDAWVVTGSQGYNAGTLLPNQVFTITFQVTVNADVKNADVLENVGMFTADGFLVTEGEREGKQDWRLCAARTTVVVDVVPTPTPTVTVAPTVVPTVKPEVLPATGPGAAMAVVLGGMVVTLVGRKFFQS